jgi:hypothetical protein
MELKEGRKWLKESKEGKKDRNWRRKAGRKEVK